MNVGDTTPVDSYPGGASPYGVLDMIGNVWEWTNSKFKSYPYDANDGREGPDYESRVLRGGSYFSAVFYAVKNVRCASRYRLNPNDGYGGIGGFRVVASPSTCER